MPSSSTSSSSSGSPDDARRWRAYFLRMVGVFCFLLVGTYAFIVTVDPFDVLPLSPALERRPVTGKQRYLHASLARKARYDSCVVGTSNLRLLVPADLNRHLGGTFANLSMNAATRHEQRSILDVFLRHHTRPRTIVLGVDMMWAETPRAARLYSYPWFPAWMYDENRWNDYAHHWDFWTLEQAWRQLMQLLGRRKPRWGDDGYQNFVPDASAFDLEKVRAKIAEVDAEDVMGGGGARPGPHTFALDELVALLEGIPPATEKILVLPPFFGVGEVDLVQAKRDLVDAVGSFENLRVLDFMWASPLTTQETNWWDRTHYSMEVAARITEFLAASRNPEFQSDVCRVLMRK